MGGRSVPIDVPDFAMESTQSQLLATLQQLVGGQSAATAKAASSIRTEQQTKKAIQDLGSKLQSDNRERMAGHARAMKDGVTSLGRQAISVAQGGNKGFQGLLRNAGLGMLATQFGMVAGYAEELGNALSYGGRIGLSFGENIMKTSKDLAEIGLSLTDLASTVGGSLTAIREFGNSVEDGSQRFIRTVLALRQASEEFGNFGMNSVEMAQYLADELELRRRVMNADEMRLMTEQDLVEAMKANLVEQEAMAKVMGQDVQERIQAQMQARRSGGGQTFLEGATDEQRQSFADMSAAMSGMGPEMQTMLIEMLGNELQGMSGAMVNREAYGQSASLRQFLSEMKEAILRGANKDEIAEIEQRFKREFKAETTAGKGISSIERLERTGNATAAMLLEAARLLVEQADGSINREEAKQQARDDGDQRGLAAAQEAAFMEGKNLVNRFITGMMGGASHDVVNAYRGFIDAMNKGFSNPNTQGIIDAFGKAFGKIGIQPWAKTIAGDANWAEKMSVTGDVMAAIGASGAIVASLKFKQGAEAFGGLVKDISELPGMDGFDMAAPMDWSAIKDASKNAIRVVVKNFEDLSTGNIPALNPPPPTESTADQQSQ